MNEERRLKIKEVKKYQNELSGEKYSIITSSLLLGTLAVTLFTAKDVGYMYYNEMQNVLTDNSLRNYYGSLVAQIISTIGVAMNSANLMISITNRKKLKSKIDEIKEELGPLFDLYEEQYEQEENRGRGR